MQPSHAVAHHGGHDHINGVGVVVAVRPPSAGGRESQSGANGAAGPASHDFVGELPLAPDERGLNGPTAGKWPN